MATYNADQLSSLATQITNRTTLVNRAASLTINRTATFARQQSVRLMLLEVNLPRSYISRNLRIVQRASPSRLSAIIRANTRNTLLTRYPHQRTARGVRVAVNAREGFQLIENAFVVNNLRFSGASGVALNNRSAVEHFRRALDPATPAKRRKLQRIIQAARRNPRGIQVLNSRSINQLFTTVREDVEPRTTAFLIDGFTTDLERLLNAQ